MAKVFTKVFTKVLKVFADFSILKTGGGEEGKTSVEISAKNSHFIMAIVKGIR